MFKFESPAQFITVSVDRKENGSIHAKESIDMRVIIFPENCKLCCPEALYNRSQESFNI